MTSELAFARGDREVPLTLKISPRARRMRLSVDSRTGQVLLTLPRRSSRRKALAWAESHRAWIEAALAKLPEPVALGPGAEIPLYGLPHVVQWDPARGRSVQRDGEQLLVGGPSDLVPARVIRWLKAHALEVLERETRRLADKAGIAVSRVAVGDPVSRWGSCSSSGAIRYSWRLILAPEFVRHATVAHEVAHRVHMDHSPAFHKLAAELLGDDPAHARQWLRRNGAGLHRFGRS